MVGFASSYHFAQQIGGIHSPFRLKSSYLLLWLLLALFFRPKPCPGPAVRSDPLSRDRAIYGLIFMHQCKIVKPV
jgi:hypothetical protein